jgi:hypothetical protein
MAGDSMKQKKENTAEETRLLRKKVKRIDKSRALIKIKSSEKAKIIKASQDRQKELQENRDEWKAKCKEQERENVELHPKKIILRKLSTGIDFIGYVLFPHHTLLRTRTKQRMKSRLKKNFDCFLNGRIEAVAMDQQLQSYLGILSHANHHTLSQALKNAYWVRQSS